MPAGASVERRRSSLSAQNTKLSVSTSLSLKGALDAEISSDNQGIADAEDYITGASRGGYAGSIISSEGSSDSSEDGDTIDELDVTQFSAAELQEQIGQQFVDGINPYVEQHMGDEEDFYVEDSSSSEGGDDVVDSKQEKTVEEKEKELTEWENPSYLVKDLDTGESYRVEEIDQQFTLVTLDSVAAQHEHKEEQQRGEEATAESTSSYLLSLYTADETADIEIEDDLPKDAEAMSSASSMRVRSSNMSALYAPSDELPTGPPVKCNFSGCTDMHQRVSGYCADHEMIAREEEDSRAQALYLIPSGARAEFIKIGSHGFAYDASNRLYTVYAIEMRCVQSGATWVIYRRYQQFKELNDRLRPMGVRVPLLPPKKLLGSFEPDFIAKRQSELSNWLRCLLNYDRVDQSAKNPHLVEEVRKFLTSKADQPPLLLDRLPLKRSRFFGASLADDGDDETNRLSAGKQNVTLQDFKMIQVIGRGSFGKVVLKQVAPPFRPCHSAMNDGEAPLNFEAEFTRLPLPSAENAAASPHSGRGLSALGVRSRRDSDTFKDFTYESPGYLESVVKKEEV
ncbi:hypothetical protein PHYPSEUDO_004045 [Phytophthora pseudosyringae]|uniref:PX domain-containing protein n=1 Tax=Phytophthora pseudosyringae TaxID=221518 RepID=A0A8T1VPL7_9STRA|nr:hypothetical protein PHYPSEUDO_004045 [Phytophthora pseudosyringae]